jgi:hypothetical protein
MMMMMMMLLMMMMMMMIMASLDETCSDFFRIFYNKVIVYDRILFGINEKQYTYVRVRS